MIRVAVVGLGKMGLSHLAIINAHAGVEVAAICDATQYLLDVLEKYTGVKTYSDYGRMLAEMPLDAVIIATPSRLHVDMVRAALDKGLHVFCEKPFTLDLASGAGTRRGGSGQGAGQPGRLPLPVRRRLPGGQAPPRAGAIGEVSHVLAEAYGPVVLKPKGSTWRTQRSEGGGCLYDYAAHPINLINWYFGTPEGGRRHGAQQHLLPRDRRRGLSERSISTAA